jgi:NAD(P)-dependent dehydrogenase (short-subunit alcohol dehydrogenase family)
MATQAILVTGAASGIGRAVAEHALGQGALVYASARKPADAEALRALGPNLKPLVFDVTDEAGVAAAAADVAAAQNGARLLGVVNNAGISVPGPLLHMTPAELRQQFEVNLIGVHHVTRAFAPLLGAEGANTLGAGAPGRFINISSVGGKRAAPFIVAYAASKFALEGYSEGLRRELMPFGVDVIVIGPGAVKTAIWAKGAQLDRARYGASIYGPILEKFQAYVNKVEAGGLPAAKLGQLVWTTLTMPNPKTRYAITPNPLEGVITGLMGPRTFDRIIARQFGMLPKS